MWILLLWACGPVVRVDQADACVVGEVDGTVTANVAAYGGETGPWSVDCAFEEDDGALVLSTAAWYNRDTSPFTSNAIGRFASGSCAWGPVEPGEVRVRYRDRELTVEVPGDEVCFQAENVVPL
jgi:hypothetical protein